jgi:DNA-binding winged helix-turn-helix (wHTH) protein
VDDNAKTTLLRFGEFELDLEAGQLLKNSRLVRLQPQPFKLLCLLTSQPGKLLTREEIRTALWKNDTFVDFEQGVNFAIKQVREALHDPADHPVYIQTVPKRGYRFLAPITTVSAQSDPETSRAPDPALEKALWANIADLRLGEARQRRRQQVLTVALVIVGLALAALLLVRGF